jgi:hypothetical protein
MIDKIWRKKYCSRLLHYEGVSKGTISECFNKICNLCYDPCYVLRLLRSVLFDGKITE